MASGRNWKLKSSKKKKTKRANRKDQTFSDLPSDLLLLIVSRLKLKDNIRASAVCKILQEACVSVRVAEKSPWLFYFSRTYDGSCALYEPSMQKIYYLELPEITGFRVCYSNDGWLLMYNSNTCQLLFFNPFTRDRILVPLLLNLAYDQRMAFSCAPTSTSCLLFTVVTSLTKNKITVMTCSPNAKEWTSHVFRRPLPPESFEQVVYANGVFFCLTESGCLSSFCPSLNIWTTFPGRPPKHSGSNGCFMTEHQGKMFLVYMYNDMNPTVLKLDTNAAKLGWTKMTNLGGLTIYASGLSSETRAEHQLSGIKNCLCLSVFRRFKRCCLFYKVDEKNKSCLKWTNHDPYANIWIAPPLNLLDPPLDDQLP